MRTWLRYGERPVTVLFTDLAGYSTWALRTGDDAAVELLREVAHAVEPAVVTHRGRVVKRLGDWLGVDVNIAARLVEKAGPDEVLVSDIALAGLDPERIHARRKKTSLLAAVKGVPLGMVVYAVTPVPAAG